MKYKLYHGTSSYLSLEAVHKYINKIREESSSQSVDILDADTIPAQKIIDTVSSPSLFTKKRTIFLKRVYKNKERTELTETLIEILREDKGEDLLIIWEDQKIRSNTKYYKFFKKNNSVEEVNKLNKRTFFSWLRQELEKQDMKIEQSVIRELAERTNWDPERCKNEIVKLKLNNPEKIIQKEDIEDLIPDTLEKEIWDLTDAINQEDKMKSVSILDRLSSQSTDANYILAMLARNLRLIYLVKNLSEEGKDSRTISSLLKIPPFTTPTLLKTSSKYSYEKIVFLYGKLSNLDFKMKTGKIDPYLGLTLICPFL